MPLTLSSPEVDQLARSLAALTGGTVEQAVEHALRHQLAREQERQQTASNVDRTGCAETASDAELLQDVREIARRFQEHAGQPSASLDHGELLYDEAGLPR